MNKGTTYVAFDDSKRKLVMGILRPGAEEPELRELANEPKLVRRLFERLKREGVPVKEMIRAGEVFCIGSERFAPEPSRTLTPAAAPDDAGDA